MVRNNVILLVLAAYLLSGCAVRFARIAPIIIDPIFETYIQEFESECSAFRPGCKVQGINITLEELKWPILGVCYTRSNGERSIIMAKATWDVLSALERMNLFRHEMGHCLFGYAHYTDGASIMSPELITDYDYNDVLLKRFYTEGY